MKSTDWVIVGVMAILIACFVWFGEGRGEEYTSVSAGIAKTEATITVPSFKGRVQVYIVAEEEIKRLEAEIKKLKEEVDEIKKNKCDCTGALDTVNCVRLGDHPNAWMCR